MMKFDKNAVLQAAATLSASMNHEHMSALQREDYAVLAVRQTRILMQEIDAAAKDGK